MLFSGYNFYKTSRLFNSRRKLKQPVKRKQRAVKFTLQKIKLRKVKKGDRPPHPRELSELEKVIEEMKAIKPKLRHIVPRVEHRVVVQSNPHAEN